MAETFKEANVNSEEEPTQHTDENEQIEESQRLEHPRTRQYKNRILQDT